MRERPASMGFVRVYERRRTMPVIQIKQSAVRRSVGRATREPTYIVGWEQVLSTGVYTRVDRRAKRRSMTSQAVDTTRTVETDKTDGRIESRHKDISRHD
jgi:hypothetical protein